MLIVSSNVLRLPLPLPIVANVKARGDKIRRRRELLGIGLRDFAGRVGISASWLCRIEKGQGDPSPDVIKRIALELQKEPGIRDAIAQIAPHNQEESHD